MNRAVFLDRDGVINQAIIREGKPYPPADLSELSILDGVNLALGKLRKAGYILIGITNQPDVARGLMKKIIVDTINNFLVSSLPLDEIRTCYHDDIDNCSCRKPLPGLILLAAAKYRIELSKSFMVGDRWRDIDAGKAAGCQTFFIDNYYAERRPDNANFYVASLLEATKIILGEIDDKNRRS